MKAMETGETGPRGRTSGAAASRRRDDGTPRQGDGRSPRLGVRQRRFVEEYLVDMSPVRAAERAGYAPERAARTAARLLRTPAVLKAVERAMDSRAARTGVTRLRDSTELTRAQAAAVAEVREGSTTRAARPARGAQQDGQLEAPVRGGVQVKLHSKLKALEMLARHLGMFGAAAGAEGDAPAGGDAPPELPAELRARIEELYPGHPDTACCREAPDTQDAKDDGDDEDGEEDDDFDGDACRYP